MRLLAYFLPFLPLFLGGFYFARRFKMGQMTWLTSLCKNLGLIAPFLTGLGAVAGLLFKVWQFKKQERTAPKMPLPQHGYPGLPVENPDLITVCSKLDTLEAQQGMIMDMNATLTEMVRSISNRLDSMDARFANIDSRITRLEDERKS